MKQTAGSARQEEGLEGRSSRQPRRAAAMLQQQQQQQQQVPHSPAAATGRFLGLARLVVSSVPQ